MRRLFLTKIFILIWISWVNGQPRIMLICPDSWGPGKYSKVTVDLSLDSSEGFARFTQDYPEGFQIEPDNVITGDFMWTDNQLNVVWMDLPENKKISFSYYVKPETSMSGSFGLESRLTMVSGGNSLKVARNLAT